MYYSFKQAVLLSLLVLAQSGTVSYAVLTSAPTAAAALNLALVGVSFEFFAFPSYFTNVTATTQCLNNFEALTGTWLHIRIRGTT
ncbi:hypothetical protein V500_03425, partial [Pseudogymnoascus sp. VKM F-4518 (FW-2643)]